MEHIVNLLCAGGGLLALRDAGDGFFPQSSLAVGLVLHSWAPWGPCPCSHCPFPSWNPLEQVQGWAEGCFGDLVLCECSGPGWGHGRAHAGCWSDAVAAGRSILGVLEVFQ